MWRRQASLGLAAKEKSKIGKKLFKDCIEEERRPAFEACEIKICKLDSEALQGVKSFFSQSKVHEKGAYIGDANRRIQCSSIQSKWIVCIGFCGRPLPCLRRIFIVPQGALKELKRSSAIYLQMVVFGCLLLLQADGRNVMCDAVEKFHTFVLVVGIMDMELSNGTFF
ncbi:hypothetical protein BUALT_Bualt19G0060100 [Buddleja alternifolia]|uniref:Uncharacterized protein n=1 Tax=Buddleja alternifolia TaxID=168488 RepID=A0AAV6W1X2_9LAMI|nr:hypothetical protein BUALT_Bualt19G0060100 [Buddleja alternifolia]